MKALNELRQFVHFLGAFNVDFLHGTRRDVFNRLCGALDIFVSAISFALMEVLIIWCLKDEGYRMSSPTASTVVNGLQGFFSSIYVISHIHRISATIDHLRSTLAKSKQNFIQTTSLKECNFSLDRTGQIRDRREIFSKYFPFQLAANTLRTTKKSKKGMLSLHAPSTIFWP